MADFEMSNDPTNPKYAEASFFLDGARQALRDGANVADVLDGMLSAYIAVCVAANLPPAAIQVALSQFATSVPEAMAQMRLANTAPANDEERPI